MNGSETTRRDFCKGAAAGIAGILAAGAAPSLYAAGANSKIRVACVGYSDRFRATLLPCFLGHAGKEGFEMVAVADLWKKRLFEKAVPEMEKRTGGKIQAFRSDEELYEKGKDIDAVIISTADFQHARHAARAVEAGKDVYCEKPMAEDMRSANLLLDAVDAKRKAGFAPGAVLQIGSQRRSGAAYHAAKKFLESGRFGRLAYVDLCWNVNQSRRWRRDEKLVKSLRKEDVDWNAWLLDRDPAEYGFDPRKYLEFRLFWPFSSGIPGQWMCHQIDTVGWFTGLKHPLSAVSSGGIYAWDDGRQSFDTFTTILEYGPSKLNGKGFQAVFSSRQTNQERGNVERYYGPDGVIDLCRGHVHPVQEAQDRQARPRLQGGRDRGRHRGRSARFRAHARLDEVHQGTQEPQRARRGRLRTLRGADNVERRLPHGHEGVFRRKDSTGRRGRQALDGLQGRLTVRPSPAGRDRRPGTGFKASQGALCSRFPRLRTSARNRRCTKGPRCRVKSRRTPEACAASLCRTDTRCAEGPPCSCRPCL